MRLYKIRPSRDLDTTETKEYMKHAAALIVDKLCASTDNSFFGVWNESESGMRDAPYTTTYGGRRMVDLPSSDSIEPMVQKCLSADRPFHMWIRSRTTCRSVFPIHDSIAYLCLGTSDEPPSATTPLIQIVECSRFLIDTDYLDGPAE